MCLQHERVRLDLEVTHRLRNALEKEKGRLWWQWVETPQTLPPRHLQSWALHKESKWSSAPKSNSGTKFQRWTCKSKGSYHMILTRPGFPGWRAKDLSIQVDPKAGGCLVPGGPCYNPGPSSGLAPLDCPE